ncbi:MAG: PKD domain-containing protein [Cyclobacteriaceae bacterium]|nr:PKD domain-containing protein [Cyclobacteriaceae bacterium]UYN85676.1 MAG: PKD domain-containing protein [Cyclobacteriaceae bacterium]
MVLRSGLLYFILFVCIYGVQAQCGGQIMEPGFAFLTSSRGCAPFTVRIETLYLSSVPGTQYFVNWGDGTPEEIYTQTNATGVIIQHTYPNSPVNCGYDVTIDAANGCNPRGSVVPIQTQVVVWTNDVISIDPTEFRVCAGFAADVRFTDNSDWNCYPRATRENNEARWIQWLYGTGPLVNQIPGVRINTILPGAFPYLNPAPNTNPIYPVLAPGLQSLMINVPVTTPADVGREFQVTLKNWNQCNPYDHVLTDGNPFNPVNGNLVNGDNMPQVVTGRIVIVPAPQPDFLTRLGNASGSVQAVFCIGDDIYFDNETPFISGANFAYTWQFFDNDTGTGTPLATRAHRNPMFSYGTAGQKLIRLRVRDTNAAGNCEAVFERIITISPSLIARIEIRDVNNNLISPNFCQESNTPFTLFNARLVDASVGLITPTTQWRWEFFDENNALTRREPATGFSSTQLGPFDETYINPGIYRARLIVRDNMTSCESMDEVFIRVLNKPVPDFTATRVCAGEQTIFVNTSLLTPIAGQQLVQWEWDMDYDGTTFSKDPTLDNQQTFGFTFGGAGIYQVALRVTTDLGGCSAVIAKTIHVDPLPVSSFTPDVTSGCSVLRVTFTNTSIAGQPDGIDRFIWEIDEGSGFQVDAFQRPTDPGFSNMFIRDFNNFNTVNKTYAVRLRTVTINGCEQVSAPVTIIVFPGPQSGFISTNYSPFNSNCSPQSVNFTVDNQTQSLNPTEYRWQVSDASGVLDDISTGTVPAFTYNFVNTGQLIRDYQVTLRTTLSTGCYRDSTRIIRINPVPVSDFAIDTIQFDCNSMRLRFEAQQKGLPEYTWAVTIDGSLVFSVTSTLAILNYDFNRIGSAQAVHITLQTRNFAGCLSPATTQSVVVPAFDNIIVAFTATPLNQTLPNATVAITNNTTPGPWEYHWDFGDGTTSTNVNPVSQTYATFGTYTITLTVKNNVCVQQQAVTITINPIPPILDFSFNPPAGCVPLTVAFTNLSRFADAATYFWQFGTGEGTSREVNPVYTYRRPGVYSVTLSATNVLGDTVTLIKAGIIEVFESPVASFAVAPTVLYIPGDKLYTSNRSLAASSYVWDFGDGGTSTEREPVYVYNEEGNYTIKLVASNSNGCSDTTTLASAVRVQRGAQLLIPNAFSPGLGGSGSGDGRNDYFLPIMRGVTEFQMMVFNRWGELLFETKNADVGWDGYYKGKLCPQDVYVYKITAKYENGNVITRVGDIHLIR